MRVARECKKIVAEILVAGIFDKHRRRHVRHILRTMEPIKNLVDFFRFLLEKKRERFYTLNLATHTVKSPLAIFIILLRLAIV